MWPRPQSNVRDLPVESARHGSSHNLGGSLMKTHQHVGSRSAPPLPPIIGLAVAGSLILAAAPASASLPCTVPALSGLVPNVTVMTATPVPASGGTPAFCSVSGFVRTTGFGAPNGSADFLFNLPANWNGKFLYIGVGGFAGLPAGQGIAPKLVDHRTRRAGRGEAHRLLLPRHP